MRTFLKVFSLALVGAGLLSVPSLAQAQEVTLRVEPGFAKSLTDPQEQRFGLGGAIAVKPELGLGSYLSVGPSLSYMALPSKISGIDTGTSLGLGGFVRVKRPHDEKNTDTGLAAVSPWVDADLKLVHTDPLDRLGASVGVGASVPTSDSRWLWVGPFARYDLVSQEDGKVNMNTNSAKTAIFGLSFEVGMPHHKKVVVVDEPKPLVPNITPEPEPVPPVVHHDEDVELRQVVQFAWDSPVLDAKATEELKSVLSKLTSAKSFKEIRVEGHASSEGQVKHNDVLAQARAQAVVDFLVANGVAKEKVSAVGFGSRVPVGDNKTEAGRVANRRAEFVVHFVVVR